MLTAVISNGEVCIPLLQFLKQHGIAVHFFYEIQDPGERAMAEGFCSAWKIPMQAGEGEASLYEWLNKISPSLVFVCGYNKRIDIASIPRSVANMFNIHPGLLPAYRGPSPVFWQLRDGAKEIGVSIHRVAQHFDAGEIVWEKKIPREEYFTYTHLTRLTNYFALEGVGMILQHLLQGKTLPSQKQDNTKAHYHKRPTLEDVSIQWQTMRADEIIRQINACNGWNKGALTTIKGMPCKIIDAIKLKIKSTAGIVPGNIIQLKDECWVACTNNEMLSITFINFDGNFVPARLFDKYGLRKGDRFE